MKRTILRAAIILPACIIIGYLLLVLVYLIPESWMHAHLIESCQQVTAQGVYPVDPVSSRTLDRFTDAAMLLECGYTGTESAFTKAANSSYVRVDGSDPYHTASRLEQARPEEISVYHDNRYWHGYQLLLRPLLLIVNFNQIQVLNAVVLYALLAAILFLMFRKARECIIPFIFAVLLLAPTAVSQCLQFSGAVYVSLLATLIILLNPKQIRSDGKVEIVFLFAGILTPFVDLLTAPTITLTLPLIVLFMLNRKQTEPYRRLLKCVLFWGIGYAFMWFGKWVIAYLANGSSFLDSLINQMRFRSDASSGFSLNSRMEPLLRNISHLGNTRWINIAILIYLVGCVVLFFVKKQKTLLPELKKLPKTVFPYVLIALIPVVWILLLSNHAMIHVFFTYRNLVPCVFAALCACTLPAFSPAEPSLNAQGHTDNPA